MLYLFNVHPNYIWTHEVEIGNGISIIATVMNYLVHIKAKIEKANRLLSAQKLASKNGEFIKYKTSVFEKRLKEAQKDIESKDSY